MRIFLVYKVIFICIYSRLWFDVVVMLAPRATKQQKRKENNIFFYYEILY